MACKRQVLPFAGLEATRRVQGEARPPARQRLGQGSATAPNRKKDHARAISIRFRVKITTIESRTMIRIAIAAV